MVGHLLACLANATGQRRTTRDLATAAEETGKGWFPTIALLVLAFTRRASGRSLCALGVLARLFDGTRSGGTGWRRSGGRRF
jgi:hypothetical protein